MAQSRCRRRRRSDRQCEGARARRGDFTIACERLPALRLQSLGRTLARREAKGDMIMVRYADDIIVGFEHEADDHVTVLWRGRVPPPFLCCRWCASAGWASAG